MKNDNFFLNNWQDGGLKSAEPTRRLNDYDCNILKEEAYKDISNELFKLEYKISRLENDLKTIDAQIQSARDISDYDTLELLTNRKYIISNDLDELIKMYNEKSISAKISGGVINLTKEKFANIIATGNAIKRLVLSFLPSKFSYLDELKQSLKKLESINQNVDELMTMQTPYGESSDKYAQLSKYITRANTIQAKIAKSVQRGQNK